MELRSPARVMLGKAKPGFLVSCPYGKNYRLGYIASMVLRNFGRGRPLKAKLALRFFRKAPSTANIVATVGILLCSGVFWTKPLAAIENLKVVRGVLILEGKIESGDYILVRNCGIYCSNS